MWEWINKNANELKSVGTLIGGFGSAYGAYSQGQQAKKIAKFNINMYNEEKKRRDDAQKQFYLGWEKSNV